MIDLLTLQKSFLLTHLKPGDTAVDFTMGNGHDTLFLSETVGPTGHVFAFDIQERALEKTKELLDAHGAENYTLILSSHHLVKDYVKTPIKAGTFNLGYLPGGGNKALTTKCETTMPAVEAALDLLDHDGVLIIAVYPGHEEGSEEGKMLDAYFETISRFKLCITKIKIVNAPTSPYFYVIERK
ncbi:MAG: class I SAM-dependent methyltransferase [Clostridia bacterium]|nr:class I SAM-dependent methyltransferase [Clostridia bacterium]